MVYKNDILESILIWEHKS